MQVQGGQLHWKETKSQSENEEKQTDDDERVSRNYLKLKEQEVHRRLTSTSSATDNVSLDLSSFFYNFFLLWLTFNVFIRWRNSTIVGPITLSPLFSFSLYGWRHPLHIAHFSQKRCRKLATQVLSSFRILSTERESCSRRWPDVRNRKF